MTWRVEMGDAVPMVAEVLGAQAAWKKLTKPAQEAVQAAYRRNGAVKCHWRTRDSLTLHGVAAWDNAAQDWLLTDAGRRLAHWNARTP